MGFLYFFKKGTKTCFFSNNPNLKKNRRAGIKKKTCFSQPWLYFKPCLWFSGTIWNN